MARNPFSQKAPRNPHLVRSGGGLSGEVADLRADVESAFDTLESQGGYFRTDEFTNPAAADADAIKTSFATSASIQSLVAANFDGVVGDDEMVPPRNVTITSTTNANVTAVAVVVTGLVRDSNGRLVAQTDTINTTNGGGATDAGTKPFSRVTSVAIPAMGGAAGSLQIGFGAAIGLGSKVKSRASLIAALRQVVAGAVVSTGTITNPSGSPVSLYTPASAPDAARDYAVTYEVDPS